MRWNDRERVGAILRAALNRNPTSISPFDEIPVDDILKYPVIWPLLQEARRLYKEGLSIRAICRIMEEKGLRGQRGELIGKTTMHRILRPSETTP